MTTQKKAKTTEAVSKAVGRKPEFNVCYSYEDGIARQIGAAWLHEEGGGMSVKLNAQCLIHNLSLFPTKGNGFEVSEDPKRPAFNVFNKRTGETRLGQIGSAWIHKSGGGINISLHAPCMVSDIALFPVKRVYGSSDSDQVSEKSDQYDAEVGGFDEDVPF